jgi:hypothetical protein
MEIHSDRVSFMKKLGLLSWRTLLVGWLRGWANRRDVIDFAVSQLSNGVDDSTLEIAQLAGADAASDADITSRLLRVVGLQDGFLDQNVVEQLKEWQPYSEVDPSARRDLDKWRLAALVSLAGGNSDRQELLDRLEEVWTEFGYPHDMEQVSRYYFTSDERAAGSQVTQDIADRPFTTMLETIDNLSHELAGRRGIVNDLG